MKCKCQNSYSVWQCTLNTYSTTKSMLSSTPFLLAKLHNRSLINIYLQYVALFVHVAQLLCAIKKEQFLGAVGLEEKMIVLNKTKILHLQRGLRHHQYFSLNFYKFHFHQVRCLLKNNRGVSEGGGQLPPTFWQNRRRRRAALLLAPTLLGSHLRP